MIVVCGEAIIDLVPDDPNGEHWTAIPGGSPANAAVALARLGIPTALLARLSEDGFGRHLRRHLEANDVDLSLSISATQRSSLALVELDQSGAASYRFDIDGAADWQWAAEELSRALPADVKAVHAGSLALILPPGGAQLEAFLTRARPGHTICIDPNVRLSIAGDLIQLRHAVERWCAIADILRASSDDVAALYPNETLEAVAGRWLRLGPAVAVITMGAAGVLAVSRFGAVTLAAPPTAVVDTVAAGDTFTAGMLASLHRADVLGGRLENLTQPALVAAMNYGLRAAAYTCSRPGADPPRLLDIQPMERPGLLWLQSG
jgi:fructokinase